MEDKAQLAKIGNRIEGISHVLHCMADKVEDEGDRVYFASTNDPHTLRRQAEYLLKIAQRLRSNAS
jgi:hypothetical protein